MSSTNIPTQRVSPAPQTFEATLPRSGVDRSARLRAQFKKLTIAEREQFTKVQTVDASSTLSAAEQLSNGAKRLPPVYTRSRPEIWRYASAFAAAGLSAFGSQFDSNYEAIELDGLAKWRSASDTEKDAFFLRNAGLAPLRGFLDCLDERDVDPLKASRDVLRPIFAGLVHGTTPLEGMKRAVEFLTSEEDVTVTAHRHRVSMNAPSGARVATRAVREYQARAGYDTKPSLIVKLPVKFTPGAQRAVITLRESSAEQESSPERESSAEQESSPEREATPRQENSRSTLRLPRRQATPSHVETREPTPASLFGDDDQTWFDPGSFNDEPNFEPLAPMSPRRQIAPMALTLPEIRVAPAAPTFAPQQTAPVQIAPVYTAPVAQMLPPYQLATPQFSPVAPVLPAPPEGRPVLPPLEFDGPSTQAYGSNKRAYPFGSDPAGFRSARPRLEPTPFNVEFQLPALNLPITPAVAPQPSPEPTQAAATPGMFENKRLGNLTSVTCTQAAKRFVLAANVDEANAGRIEPMVINGIYVEETWGELRSMARDA